MRRKAEITKFIPTDIFMTTLVVQDTNDSTVDSRCEILWKKMIGKPYSGGKLDQKETN